METQFDVLRKTCMPYVRKMVILNGGSYEDAKEILSEALAIYWAKDQLVKKASPTTYICAVASRLWMKELRRRRIAQKHSRTLIWHQEQPIRCAVEEEEVLLAFENLPNDRAKQILIAFYIEKMSMAEIARHFGFPTENATKKHKFRAINKVRMLLRKKLPHVFQAA